MATSRADRLAIAYRDQLAALREAVRRRVEREFDDVDMDDVMASFAVFAARIEPALLTGQAAITRLATAFVRAHGLASTGERIELDHSPAGIVGTTRAGEPLLSGMGAWGPMVLDRIGSGSSIAEARDFGRFLAERFTDGELTGAADRELARQGVAVSQLVGWTGTVEPDSCDPCLANAGPHELGWQPYRHGGCNCVVAPVFEAAG